VWGYLWSVLALAALCAGWVLFQRWLAQVDPDGQTIENRCGGCGSCTRDCSESEVKTS
jgi:polyferredoxin